MTVKKSYLSYAACLPRRSGTKAGVPGSAITCPFPPSSRSQPSPKKGRNCETNPILFKTCCHLITNNEEIYFFLKSKSYDGEDSASASVPRLPKPVEGYYNLLNGI